MVVAGQEAEVQLRSGTCRGAYIGNLVQTTGIAMSNVRDEIVVWSRQQNYNTQVKRSKLGKHYCFRQASSFFLLGMQFDCSSIAELLWVLSSAIANCSSVHLGFRLANALSLFYAGHVLTVLCCIGSFSKSCHQRHSKSKAANGGINSYLQHLLAYHCVLFTFTPVLVWNPFN